MHGELFLVELGGVVVLLAILARVAGRVGVSPIPFYLLAGLAFGQGGVIPLVTAGEFIEQGATIGLVLLLFTLGLDYSPAELVDGMRRHGPSGGVDLVLNGTPGVVVALVLGWDPIEAVLLGGITYISSSGVASRLLDELGWLGNREAPTVLTLLVLEDLVMAAYLPIVSILLVGGSAFTIALSVVLAFGLVTALLFVAARYGTAVTDRILGGSDEAVLLAMLGITLLVAGAAELVNISAAVGAFLTGIVLSGGRAQGGRALVGPLRDVFSAAFFLFFGFQIDPGSIPGSLTVAAVLAGIGAATKLATAWWSAKRADVGRRGRWRAGSLLLARGEFSIVIAGLAAVADGDSQLQTVTATYVLLLAVAGPIATRIVHRAQQPGSVPTTPPA